MPGGDGRSYQRRGQSGNWALGFERQDLGKRFGAEWSGHSQRSLRGSARSLCWNGACREGKPKAVSKVRPGNYTSFQEREQLPATAEVSRNRFPQIPSSSIVSIFSQSRDIGLREIGTLEG